MKLIYDEAGAILNSSNNAREGLRVCLLGATGMVGSEVLTQCLNDDRVASILVIGRRSVGVQHDKITEIELENFLDFSSVEDKLADINVCIYCLGVYQAQVSKQQFWEITVDYLNALIKTLVKINYEVRFCLFSAQGASPSGKSPIRFAKAKGRAENILMASRLSEKYIFRPGFIMPGPERKSPSLGERLFRPIYRLFPVFGIDAPDLATVMLKVGINGDQKTIFENRDLRRYDKVESD
jgi:uncharacterized protein YbjT (DUF2867 family)